MDHSAPDQETPIRGVGEKFLVRVFFAFVLLALLSIGISVAGKYFGRQIALAGHTADTTRHEIVIGNNVLSVPANAVRFESERKNGTSSSLHLYLRWPEMQGYTHASRDAFNHADGDRSIIFLSFEPQIMSRDMSGRFDPIYRSLITEPGTPGPAELTFHDFNEKSGYQNEVLVVGPEGARRRFVARCLTGMMAEESLADCERDILIGHELNLVYRFPNRMLAEWRALDKAVLAYAEGALQSER